MAVDELTTTCLLKGTVKGQLVSKANSRQAVLGKTKTGKTFTRFIKSQKAFDFEYSATIQLKHLMGLKKPLNGVLGLYLDIYYPSNRQDLDPSLFMDVLQRAGVIENDRQFQLMFLRKFIDKEDPRVEFKIFGTLEIQNVE